MGPSLDLPVFAGAWSRLTGQSRPDDRFGLFEICTGPPARREIHIWLDRKEALRYLTWTKMLFAIDASGPIRLGELSLALHITVHLPILSRMHLETCPLREVFIAFKMWRSFRSISFCSISFCSIVVCSTAIVDRCSADPPNKSPNQLVLLRNGEVLQGHLTRDDDHYLVRRGGSATLRIPYKDISHVGSSMADLYEHKSNRIVEFRAEEHLELAAWCLENHLESQATHHILRAETINPLHSHLPLMKARLERYLQTGKDIDSVASEDELLSSIGHEKVSPSRVTDRVIVDRKSPRNTSVNVITRSTTTAHPEARTDTKTPAEPNVVSVSPMGEPTADNDRSTHATELAEPRLATQFPEADPNLAAPQLIAEPPARTIQSTQVVAPRLLVAQPVPKFTPPKVNTALIQGIEEKLAKVASPPLEPAVATNSSREIAGPRSPQVPPASEGKRAGPSAELTTGLQSRRPVETVAPPAASLTAASPTAGPSAAGHQSARPASADQTEQKIAAQPATSQPVGAQPVAERASNDTVVSSDEPSGRRNRRGKERPHLRRLTPSELKSNQSNTPDTNSVSDTERPVTGQQTAKSEKRDPGAVDPPIVDPPIVDPPIADPPPVAAWASPDGFTLDGPLIEVRRSPEQPTARPTSNAQAVSFEATANKSTAKTSGLQHRLEKIALLDADAALVTGQSEQPDVNAMSQSTSGKRLSRRRLSSGTPTNKTSSTIGSASRGPAPESDQIAVTQTIEARDAPADVMPAEVVPNVEIPSDLLKAYVTSIQPMLLTRCASTACHGSGTSSEFHLHPLAEPHRPTRATTMKNLASVIEQMTDEDIASSPLVTWGQKPHGESNSKLLAITGVNQQKRLLDWLQGVSNSRRITGDEGKGANPDRLTRGKTLATQREALSDVSAWTSMRERRSAGIRWQKSPQDRKSIAAESRLPAEPRLKTVRQVQFNTEPIAR